MTSPVEMGVGFYSMQSTYMRPRRLSYVYEEAARETRLAEDLGFDVLWMGEHHHAYDSYCPSLIAAGAFLAASTSRIVLAAGVLVVPHHRAERIAEASAAFQSMTPGRLRLAIGIGYWIDEFSASGVRLPSRARLLDDTLDRLTTGDLRPRMGATELWSGQTGAAGIARAARRGLPLLLAGATADRVRAVRQVYEPDFRPYEGSRPRLVVFRDVWVDRDPRRIEWVRGRLLEMWRNYGVAWIDDPSFRGLSPADGPEARLAQREELAHGTSRLFISGSPAEVVDQLGPIVDAGADGFAFRIRFDGVGGPDLERCMEQLGLEVVPQLQRTSR
jgi:alkanesulfonate monooxygenase SsuD/methylene tetrahydromethanopterin reductase-like flavin-dependent oxidoreductase (luciferase family)